MITNFQYDVVQIIKIGSHYQVKLVPFIDYSEHSKGVRNNSTKLKNNISRAITTCREIALSNEWDYFITLTLDPERYDRYNLSKFHKDITSFIKSTNRKYDCRILFLLVPEQHKNGAWHLHGLVKNIPDYLVLQNKYGYLDWPLYSSKFGFCSLSNVNSNIAISLYITKHLSKQIYNGVIEVGQHLYYCSRGLKRAEKIKELKLSELPKNFIFQYNDNLTGYKSSFFEDDTFLKNIGML